jgi:hypothetical protein
MDTQQLIKDAKSRFGHQEAKIYLREKYSNQLTFVQQSGCWTASPELIAYLKSAAQFSILIDNYDNPVKVDTQLLLTDMEKRYNEVAEQWLTEFNQTRELR